MTARAQARVLAWFCVAALWVAHASIARAAETEAIALSLQNDEASACLSAEQLALSISERLGKSVSVTSTGAALSVSVQVHRTPTGAFAVTIESRERATDSTGRRELEIAGECATLTAPLSLVIALMLGPDTATASSARAAAPEPATAPEPAAAPPAPVVPASAPLPPPAPARPPMRPLAARTDFPAVATRVELGLGGGADVGMLPEHSALVQISGRLRWIPPRAEHRGLSLTSELALELWLPQTFEREGTRATVSGATLGTALCGGWSYGRTTFEPCAGLWFRPLHAEADEDIGASKLFLLSGWSLRATVRYELSAPWSVFAGVQALSPFGPWTLALARPRPASSVPEEPNEMSNPFANATQPDPSRVAVASQGQNAIPIVGRPLEATSNRLVLHELPAFAAVLVVGVTLAL